MGLHRAGNSDGVHGGWLSRGWGFTLIEILITVIILAVLASIVVPMFSDFSEDTELQTVVHNWKYAVRAVRVYRVTEGAYPNDRNPAQYPSGMQNLLEGMDWTQETPAGGQWDWDRNVFGVAAAISIHRPDWSPARMAKVDAAMDDGNLFTGCFRIRSGGYMYVIEE